MRTRAMAVLLAIALSAASAALVTSTSAAAAKIDAKGILRVGTSLTAVQGGSQFDLDPAKSDLLQVGYLRPIYDTLLHVAVDEYRKEQLLSLRRYAGYWDAPAYRLGGIDFVNSSADLNASLSSLFGGSFDLLGISQAQADAVKRQSGFSVFKQPSEDTYYFLAICNTTPPFDKAKFRQALQFAIN